MKLSIIILNYKTKELLRQSLKSVGGLSLPFDHEIIVADNNSCDGSSEMVREVFPNVKVIDIKKNIGFAGGINVAIQKAQGDYILHLNTDVIILDDSITRMVEYMETHQDIGVLGPRLQNPDRSVQYSCMRFPAWYMPIVRRTPLGKTRWGKAYIDDYLLKDWDHNENKEIDWIIGAVILIRKKAHEQVGPFDERFFIYLEDTDYCRRHWEKGWKVAYFSNTNIIHYHKRESCAHSFRRQIISYPTRLHIKSFIKYVLKYKNSDAINSAENNS